MQVNGDKIKLITAALGIHVSVLCNWYYPGNAYLIGEGGWDAMGDQHAYKNTILNVVC